MLSYVPFVRAFAYRVYEKLPPGASLELEDLVQAGSMGLVNASRAYDPSANVSFLLYAKHRIKGEILDTLRRLDPAPRHLRRLEKRKAAAARKLTASLQRTPSEEEVYQLIGLKLEAARTQSAALATIQRVCDLEESARTVSAPPAAHPDSICAQKEGLRCLTRVLQTLSDRHRKVIWLYYGRGMTMKQIGQRLSVNESRICQMHKGALDSMARALRASGFRSSADLRGLHA